jgi:hypothetical protein
MHSDLLERAQAARERIGVPAFPVASIRSAAARAPKPAPRRRTLLAAILAGFSVVAIATAAEVLQTHIKFTPGGGMVISSVGKGATTLNPTDDEIREAAARLDFHAIVPSGLPEGTVAKQLQGGSSAMDIRYDLPGAERASHHMLYIFLANPATISGKAPGLASPRSNRTTFAALTRAELFRVGDEQVIVVSNGLTAPELASIKASMQAAALK